MTSYVDTIDVQSKLSKTWRVLGKNQASYTDGPLLYTNDGSHMICIDTTDHTSIVFIRLSTGQIVHKIECGEEDTISAFTISANQKLLITAHIRSTLIKVWNIETKQVLYQYKSEHHLDITTLLVDQTNTLLVTGSLDSSVKIRYIMNGHFTHSFPNHGSAITRLDWHPDFDKLLLLVGTNSGTIRAHWLGNEHHSTRFIDLERNDYDSNSATLQQRNAGAAGSAATESLVASGKSHLSKVTSFKWSECGTILITTGFDQTVRLWKFTFTSVMKPAEKKVGTQQSKSTKNAQGEHNKQKDTPQVTAPVLQMSVKELHSFLVLEDLESVVVLPTAALFPSTIIGNAPRSVVASVLHFVTCGAKGRVLFYRFYEEFQGKTNVLQTIYRYHIHQAMFMDIAPYSVSQYSSATETGGILQEIQQYLTTELESNDELDASTQALLRLTHMSIFKSFQSISSDQYRFKPIKFDADKEAEAIALERARIASRKAQLQEANKVMGDHDGDENDNGAAEPQPEELQPEEEKGTLSVDLHPNEYSLYIMNGSQTLYVISLATMLREKILSCNNNEIIELRVIPHSRFILFITNDSKYIQLMNIDTFHITILPQIHHQPVTAIDVSHCGRFLVSCDASGAVLLHTLFHYDAEYNLIPIPYQLDSDDDDNEDDSNAEDTVKREPTDTQQQQKVTHSITSFCVGYLPGHSNLVTAVTFTRQPVPNFSHRTSTALSMKKFGKLGDTVCQTNIHATTHPVYSYNRFNLFVITGSQDRTLRLWNVSPFYIFADPLLHEQWTRVSTAVAASKLGSAKASSSPEVTSKDNQYDSIILQLYDKSLYDVSSLLFSQTINTPSQLLHAKKVYQDVYKNNTTKAVQDSSASPLIIVTATTSVLGHNDGVNTLSVNKANTMLVTSSDDKTSKIYSISTKNLTQLAILRGHRRPVNAALISPHEQLVLTVSGDKTIRLWSLDSFNCVKTLQGHTDPIVNVRFIREGLQCISVDSAGILRLWNLDGECVSVCDEPHHGRINTIDVASGDTFMVTGDTQSKIVVWHDTTVVDHLKSLEEEQHLSLQKQMLENAIQRKQYDQSFELALQLKHYRQLYQILNEVIDQEVRYKKYRHLNIKRKKLKQIERQQKLQMDRELSLQIQKKKRKLGQMARKVRKQQTVEETYAELFLMLESRENLELRVPKPKTTVKSLMLKRTILELGHIMNVLKDWNTNSKFSSVAHYVLQTIFNYISPDVLIKIPQIKEMTEILQVYSTRHFNRTNNLLQSSYVMDHLLSSMQILLPQYSTLTPSQHKQLSKKEKKERNLDHQSSMQSIDELSMLLSLDVFDSGEENEIISSDDDDIVTTVKSVDFYDDEIEDEDEDDLDSEYKLADENELDQFVSLRYKPAPGENIFDAVRKARAEQLKQQQQQQLQQAAAPEPPTQDTQFDAMALWGDFSNDQWGEAA